VTHSGASAAALARPAGPPGAVEVADILLGSILARGATSVWFDRVVDGSHQDAHRVTLERGRTQVASVVLGGGLGDAVIARLGFLAGLDLLAGQSQSGRCRIRSGRLAAELLVTVRATDACLTAELRTLDDRGGESGAPVASLPGGAVYPEILEPGTTVGPYRVEEQLGRGGMGVVYRVEHTLLGKRFAMKVLLREVLDSDPDSARRFVREARAAARVLDDGIVAVSDFGSLSDGRSYLVMELLSGMSLLELIRGQGAIEPRRALGLLRRVGLALRAAHDCGVVHRDLSPSNIFLSVVGGEERIKLVDFGAAKLAERDGSDHADVPDGPEGMVLGTPYYMAPEQALGRETDVRSDIYALGVVCFELITGDVPFDGQSVREVVLKHINAPAPAPESPLEPLPEEIKCLVLRCMAKNPAERYQTVSALLEDLDRALLLLGRKGWRRWLP
jgi:tRNA A-37 threonylcarbamoyl transferase component Bud32